MGAFVLLAPNGDGEAENDCVSTQNASIYITQACGTSAAQPGECLPTLLHGTGLTPHRVRKGSLHAVDVQNDFKHPPYIMPTDNALCGALWRSGYEMHGCMQTPFPVLCVAPSDLR